MDMCEMNRCLDESVSAAPGGRGMGIPHDDLGGLS